MNDYRKSDFYHYLTINQTHEDTLLEYMDPLLK